ncbi:EAL domain-containing protein [Bacillus massilinigeriensis]|uniref:EAL domain-containing protein n=1 Tax=Bacillus mediterraneensis TaxID=1805474 RepID=UPI0008F8B82F|nr:EAL-associated domain-containing protein [Bacillus mediterraneensis]
MDALDVMAALDQVYPVFQPIFSADEHRVIGYEIFGRFRHDGESLSLGPFFLDDQVPADFRLEADLLILEKAFEKALELDGDILLFINRDAELLIEDKEEKLLTLILSHKEKGLDPSRLVLEISERKSMPDTANIEHILHYYRTYGIKIAIDKLGADSSKLDQINLLQPDILKVDLGTLRGAAIGPSYQDILHSLSLLARKIGASLLFESIETVFQLQFAWKHGGRYYQGFYLMNPSPSFVKEEVLNEKLRTECHAFILTEQKKIERLFSLRSELNQRLQELNGKLRKKLDDYELLMAIGNELDEIAFRMYICDSDGFQDIPNLVSKKGSWQFEEGHRRKNWSWRPYFLENISNMRSERKGFLSDRYNDIQSGETIRTFSFPIGEERYLFVDLHPKFLNKREELY